MNIRHNIDPKLIRASVEHRCAEHERFRAQQHIIQLDIMKRYTESPGVFRQKPDGIDWIDPAYDKYIKEEREYYSTVRVVKIGHAKYVLVYGDQDDATVTSGTGPFKTLKAAKQWFLNHGR